jgi:hypothetical protein
MFLECLFIFKILRNNVKVLKFYVFKFFIKEIENIILYCFVSIDKDFNILNQVHIYLDM